MKLKIIATSKFKKDLKTAIKRGCDTTLLNGIVEMISNGVQLPEKNKDHSLIGDWVGYRECHISPDWLLIYKIDTNVVILLLYRTGSHSDLF